MTQSEIQRAAGLAVRGARLRLERKGMVGEPARLRSMSDVWTRFAIVQIEKNWAKVQSAKAHKVVRELATIVSCACLKAELKNRMRNAGF